MGCSTDKWGCSTDKFGQKTNKRFLPLPGAAWNKNKATALSTNPLFTALGIKKKKALGTSHEAAAASILGRHRCVNSAFANHKKAASKFKSAF